MAEIPVFATAQTIADLTNRDPRSVARELTPIGYLRTGDEGVKLLYNFHSAIANNIDEE